RDLRTRLNRGETQSPRSRLRPGCQRRADRMEPRPRTAQLARQPPLTTTALCAALGRQPCSPRELQASTAHNPTLLIRVADFTAARQYCSARARSGVAGWRVAAGGAGEVRVSRHRCGQGESAIVVMSRIFVPGKGFASRARVDRVAEVDRSEE